MVDAVVAGLGLQKVAELAAEAAGAPVAIVLPRLGVSVCWPPRADPQLAALSRYVAARLKDRPAEVPEDVAAEVAITAGGEALGAVMLAGEPATSDGGEALECLHLAAVASLTELAVEEAKAGVEQDLRGSFLEELRRGGEIDPTQILRRAGRLGCDLSLGAVVLCVELSSERPRHVIATIAGEHPGALAEHVDERVYALLPAVEGEDCAQATLDAANRVSQRLEQHGTVGVSSFYTDPAEFVRAVEEAELVLDVLRHGDAPAGSSIGTGTYRLLFRVLASHPEEIRAFYEDTVAELVNYDAQYSTDLTGTLEAYLEHNCNMNATAAAIYAHRHTIAYRLDRIRDLTGLDPAQSEQRERLSLGLKAHRIIAPHLHK